MIYLEQNISVQTGKIRYNGLLNMAMIICDMVISREIGHLLTYQFKFIRPFQPEIGKTKFDQITLTLI